MSRKFKTNNASNNKKVGSRAFSSQGRGDKKTLIKSQKNNAVRQSGLHERSSKGNPSFLYGFHAVTAALLNPNRKIRSLQGTAPALTRLAERIGGLMEGATVLKGEEIDAAAPAGAVHQGLLLDCAPLSSIAIEDAIKDANGAPFLVLDQVTDPQNVGAVLRSAAAFGVCGILLQDHNAPPETGSLAKAASGALELVPLIRVGNLSQALEKLKEAGYWVVGLDGGQKHVLGKTEIMSPTALVLGAEGSGLRRLTAERCDLLASIPMSPVAAERAAEAQLDSLNVSNAAAIALYELMRGR